MIRGYYILSKNKDLKEINELNVYVKDDREKWSRKKALEEFESIIVKNNSITLWKKIKVGLTIDKLMSLISEEEYYKDFGSVKLYSKEFESTFIIKNNRIKEIEVKRRCR